MDNDYAEDISVVHLFAYRYEAALKIVEKFIESGTVEATIEPEEVPFKSGFEPFVILTAKKVYYIHSFLWMDFYDKHRGKNSNSNEK